MFQIVRREGGIKMKWEGWGTFLVFMYINVNNTKIKTLEIVWISYRDVSGQTEAWSEILLFLLYTLRRQRTMLHKKLPKNLIEL